MYWITECQDSILSPMWSDYRFRAIWLAVEQCVIRGCVTVSLTDSELRPTDSSCYTPGSK